MKFVTKESIDSAIKEGKNPFYEFGFEKIREAVGDGPFGALLKNTANKQMLKAFEFFPATWSQIVNKPYGSRKDFKENTLIQIEEMNRLSKVSKRKNVEMDTLGERSLTYKVDTYEGGYQIHRQDIINDDLGAFMKFPTKQGRAAARTIDKFVWDFVNDNSTLGLDSTALFHANHGNLLTTSPLNTTNLDLATTKMLNFTEPNSGDKLGVRAGFVAGPPSLENLGRRLVESVNLQGTANNDINIFRNLRWLTVPWLTDSGSASTADWYVIAAPGQVDSIQLDFLRGQQTPQTLYKAPTGDGDFDFDTGTWQFKTRYEFGGALADFRWIVKGDAA